MKITTTKDDLNAAITLLLSAVLEVLLCGFFVTLFWDLTIPGIISSLGPINYWQGLGLFMLFKFLTYRD